MLPKTFCSTNSKFYIVDKILLKKLRLFFLLNFSPSILRNKRWNPYGHLEYIKPPTSIHPSRRMCFSDLETIPFSVTCQALERLYYPHSTRLTTAIHEIFALFLLLHQRLASVRSYSIKWRSLGIEQIPLWRCPWKRSNLMDKQVSLFLR